MINFSFFFNCEMIKKTTLKFSILYFICQHMIFNAITDWTFSIVYYPMKDFRSMIGPSLVLQCRKAQWYCTWWLTFGFQCTTRCKMLATIWCDISLSLLKILPVPSRQFATTLPCSVSLQFWFPKLIPNTALEIILRLAPVKFQLNIFLLGHTPLPDNYK